MTTINLKTTFASLPRTTRGKPIVVNGDPKGKNFLYTNGKNVYIRNVSDTTECDVYSEHSRDATVAKYSPSGFYIASGDTSGKIRIWDTVNPEHILKHEVAAMAGPIKDIDWTMDNTKIICGGEGRESFGRAFMWDTGNSCGDVAGHTKHINSVSIKQSRPMRAATASEDMTSIFHEGPPFKNKATKREHTNFVQCVRFSPDGSKYITAGSDGKMFIYEGKEGELIGELGAPKAHKGGIYAISFNGDGSKLLSVSGDKTAKVWNLANNEMESECVFGKEILDMQVGCLWQGDNILSVSLAGHIHYLDPANPAQIKKTIRGHNKPLTGLAVSPDGSRFYTSASDGLVVSWDAATGEAVEFQGKGHNNQVQDLALDGDWLVSVGIDDTLRFSQAGAAAWGGEIVKLDGQPLGVDAKNGVAVVAGVHEVSVYEAPGRKLSSCKNSSGTAKCVSISPNGSMVAVGSDARVHIYQLSDGQLCEMKSVAAENCCAVAWSPCGGMLAASAGNQVMVLDANNNYEDTVGAWGKCHTAKVTSLAWSPDGAHIASGAIDSMLVLWTVGNYKGDKPKRKAHPLSHITRLGWLDNHRVVTAGQDSDIKIWAIVN